MAIKKEVVKEVINNAENYEQIIKSLELKLKSQQNKWEDKQEDWEKERYNFQGTIDTLNELLGKARKELKQLEMLNNKLTSYKKVIQFMAGIESGDVLTSEVK